MPLEHFDGGDECSRGHLARRDIARDDGFGLARVLTDDSRRVLPAESPTAISRLVARSRRDVSFAPPDPAVAVAYLDDDRFKLGEGAIRQHIRTTEGQPHGSQHNLLQSHGLSSVACVVMQSLRPQWMRSSPLIWLRCMTRRVFGSNGSRRCNTERLFHIKRS